MTFDSVSCSHCNGFHLLDDDGLCVTCSDLKVDYEIGRAKSDKGYYQCHKSDILARQRVYDATHTEQRKAYDANHREEINAYMRGYKKGQRSKAQKRHSAPPPPSSTFWDRDLMLTPYMNFSARFCQHRASPNCLRQRCLEERKIPFEVKDGILSSRSS